MNFLFFLAPFSWGTQKREAAAPKASACFMGGTCAVREEPGKQKLRSCRAQELARSSAQEKERQKRDGLLNTVRIDHRTRLADAIAERDRTSGKLRRGERGAATSTAQRVTAENSCVAEWPESAARSAGDRASGRPWPKPCRSNALGRHFPARAALASYRPEPSKLCPVHRDRPSAVC